MALGHVEERLSHGSPTWFFRGKRTFATYVENHHGAREALWCAAPAGAKEMLMLSDPSTFFNPPFVGVRGWVGVYLDGELNWDEVGSVVEEAYRFIEGKMEG